MREGGHGPLRFRSGRSFWRCCWWWRSTDGGSSRWTPWRDDRTANSKYRSGSTAEKTLYLLAVLPAFWLKRHHSDRTRHEKKEKVESISYLKSEYLKMETSDRMYSWKTSIHFLVAFSLLAIKGSDLEAKSAVITVYRHDGTVVEVCDQAARHLASALLHQITALCEEVLTLPGCRHQPRLTERHTEELLWLLGWKQTKSEDYN